MCSESVSSYTMSPPRHSRLLGEFPSLLRSSVAAHATLLCAAAGRSDGRWHMVMSETAIAACTLQMWWR